MNPIEGLETQEVSEKYKTKMHNIYHMQYDN